MNLSCLDGYRYQSSFHDQILVVFEYQQTDIYNGLLNMTSNISCSSSWHGDPINEPTATPEYIIHRRGDRRNLVTVLVDGVEYTVRLNGDDTDFMGASPPNAAQVINYINFVRGKAQSRAD